MLSSKSAGVRTRNPAAPPTGMDSCRCCQGRGRLVVGLLSCDSDARGVPEAHPDAIKDPAGATEEEYRKDLAYLKEKVDAGAEMIITQLFYDVDIFLKFVQDCKDIGINVPIVPGIMPIMTYGGFKRMTGFCKTKVGHCIQQSTSVQPVQCAINPVLDTVCRVIPTPSAP